MELPTETADTEAWPIRGICVVERRTALDPAVKAAGVDVADSGVLEDRADDCEVSTDAAIALVNADPVGAIGRDVSEKGALCDCF